MTEDWRGAPLQSFTLHENDWWNLDNFLVSVIYPALKLFVEHERLGIPLCAFGDDDWDAENNRHKDGTLDKASKNWESKLQAALAAFEIMSNDIDGMYVREWQMYPDTWLDMERERQAKVTKGLQVFAEIFRSLWD